MSLQRTFALEVPAERARRSMTRALDLVSSSRRVRVPVAVVFADLSDFDAWTAAHGAAAAADLMSLNALTVVPIVESPDGHVVKHLGDGFMLAFRDPRQAVLAAVETGCAVSDVHSLRVGGHWGQPIVSGRDLIGHDVNHDDYVPVDPAELPRRLREPGFVEVQV